MKEFFNTKIKSENPVWVILLKWAVGIILIFGLLMFLMNPELLKNIISIYEGMEKEGISWFVLWLYFLPAALICGLMIVAGSLILPLPSKKKKK